MSIARAAGIAALALSLFACAGGDASKPETSKLDPQLQALAAQPGSNRAVPVIVTLVPTTSAASFTPAGLAVTYRFVSINAVAGSVPVAQLSTLATAPEVLRVEEDGEMKTLSPP
jgi:hypothetical protein